MKFCKTEIKNHCLICELCNGEDNRLNYGVWADVTAALELAEADPGVQSFVLTATPGSKFFSNGLDTAFLAANIGEFEPFLLAFMRFLARLLTANVLTIAAIGGHCVAGGMIMALACDIRVMRTDRGWLALPEVHLGMGLTPGLVAVVRLKVPRQHLTRTVLLGEKMGAKRAQELGLVDHAVAAEEVLPLALQIGAKLTVGRVGRAEGGRGTLGLLKRVTYADTVRLLTSGGMGEVSAGPFLK